MLPQVGAFICGTGTNYIETLRVQIHANCRIRRIYFSDRLYSEEELPPEFKLFLPIQKSWELWKPFSLKEHLNTTDQADIWGCKAEGRALPSIDCQTWTIVFGNGLLIQYSFLLWTILYSFYTIDLIHHSTARPVQMRRNDVTYRVKGNWFNSTCQTAASQ